MSLSDETEELLSGYLDNQLDADDLRKVKAALADPAVQARYEDFIKIRQDLRSLAAISVRGLPADFAQRVLSVATARASADESSVSLPNALDAGTDSDDRRGKPYAWLAAVVGLAATVALAIWIPQALERKSVLPFKSSDLVAQGDSNPGNSSSGNSNANEASSVDSTEIQSQTPVDRDPQERYVRRADLNVQYVMTLDLELSEKTSMAKSLGPLMNQFGIELVKGAKVGGDLKLALDKIRVTPPPEDAPLPSEVYLFRAPTESIGNIVEVLMNDLANYPVARLGLAFEMPSDPLIDQLSVNSPGKDSSASLGSVNSLIGLSQMIADAVSNYVDADDAFAAPLVAADREDFRASPFDSIPPQGKLIGSSKRTKSAAPTLDSMGDGKFAFLLLFVRQR